MMLTELLRGLDVRIIGKADRPVARLVTDSRTVEPGDAFVAIRGASFDGHEFLEEARRRGATTLIVEEWPGPPDEEITVVLVENTRRALATLAANAYDRPWKELTLVGITGTNGKTSTAYLVQSLLECAGLPCARFGTVGHSIGDVEVPATTTTPDALEVNRLLRLACDRGLRAAAMEVSSHALATHRVDGILFDAAVWTNLTQDHLDFHETMEAYRETKQRLFEQIEDGGVAVLNRDDPSYDAFRRTAEARAARLLSFGRDAAADVRAEDVHTTLTETAFTLVHRDRLRIPIRLQLLGEYNVANALTALAVGIGFGFDADVLREGVESLRSVPGRFERIDEGQPFAVVVDYAHTPDALANVLHAARTLNPRRLLVVFGCGGDRDRGKRPKMGRIAVELADVVVLTSDNPRSEDPVAILRDIEAGIPSGRSYETIPDREAAIRRAIERAEPGDFVVIAGKGHETYQILGDETIHFDDREVARSCLAERFG